MTHTTQRTIFEASPKASGKNSQHPVVLQDQIPHLESTYTMARRTSIAMQYGIRLEINPSPSSSPPALRRPIDPPSGSIPPPPPLGDEKEEAEELTPVPAVATAFSRSS